MGDETASVELVFSMFGEEKQQECEDKKDIETEKDEGTESKEVKEQLDTSTPHCEGKEEWVP